MRLIDADLLYMQLQKDEELARKRVLDTESFLPYPNNLNPSYTRYVAQMDERTRLKHMVADAPTIEERKTGRWVKKVDDGVYWYECSECGDYPLKSAFGHDCFSDWCPHCGARLEGAES